MELIWIVVRLLAVVPNVVLMVHVELTFVDVTRRYDYSVDQWQ